MSTADEVMPEGQWSFDAEVTDAFDDMLSRSIPQYDVMRSVVTEVAEAFVREKTWVVDLGCSRGEALAPLVDSHGAHNRFLGLEVSKPMLEASRARFAGYIQTGVVEIREHDLRQGVPPVNASVILSVLTLQFTPIEYRQLILRTAWQSLFGGGALVLVEKVLGASAELDRLMVERYYGLKRRNQYTDEQIERKRLSLEGVLVPVTARWNEELLANAGFTQVECVWRWMNFAAWVAVREAS